MDVRYRPKSKRGCQVWRRLLARRVYVGPLTSNENASNAVSTQGLTADPYPQEYSSMNGTKLRALKAHGGDTASLTRMGLLSKFARLVHVYSAFGAASTAEQACLPSAHVPRFRAAKRANGAANTFAAIAAEFAGAARNGPHTVLRKTLAQALRT